MTEPLALGVCRGYRWRPGAERVAVVLPGRLPAGDTCRGVASPLEDPGLVSGATATFVERLGLEE